MKLEGHIYCEGPGCEAHSHVGVGTMHAGRLPIGFVKAIWYDENGDTEYAFCGTDCLMKWAGEFPPEEIIPWGSPPEEGTNG